MLDLLIVIPARFGSTRFPGKPLAMIAGVPMLRRVVDQARAALARLDALGGLARGDAVVATDSPEIAAFAAREGLPCVDTPASCPTGSDRAHAAVAALGRTPDVVVNWQGDNPCCPPGFVAALAAECARDPAVAVATPCVRLRWTDLDRLRADKRTTPFSGTFAALGGVGPYAPDAVPARLGAYARGVALFFSKREIPALRREDALRREGGEFSPLYRHIGLYAYRADALARFAAAPPGACERLEGLEQLRFLEHGAPIRAVVMDDGGRAPMTGVDSPEDIPRVEAWLAAGGGS